jgi:NhaA family Na+:H+ antiporter
VESPGYDARGVPGSLVGVEPTMSTHHDDRPRPPWSRSDRPIARGVVRPLQEFLQTSTSSAFLLFAAAALALVWANLGDTYESFWTTPLVLRLGDTTVGYDLRWWVNDGLMALFFLVVGIEIKRELTIGELRRPRAAALPIIAAVGGMVAPALLFVAVVRGGDGADGWGIPMATDIALALGALALAASHAPTSLKPLLLTLAIVDDIGAIIVIALFYSGGIETGALAVAVAVVAVILGFERIHVRFQLVYVVLGVALWYAIYRAGVHPTIAGVIMGLLTPARPFQRPRAVSAEAHRIADETSDDPEPPDADAASWLELAWLSREAVSPMARVEHTLLPWTSFVVVPLFALANAGVPISAAALSAAVGSAVAWGIAAGLVIGKPLGIWLASRLALRTGIGEAPDGLDRLDLLGMGATAGIGFTVALFIADLAYGERPELHDPAVIAILVASVVAGVLGQAVLRAGGRRAARA